MKPEEKKVLNEFLSKTLKIDEEKLATLYNEAGDLLELQAAFDADASRVRQFGVEKTNQFNRGLKEGASKIEKELKSKYEVESDLIGVELVDFIVLSKVEEVTKTSGTKDISKHPEMIRARAEWEKEQRSRDKDWEVKLTAKDTEIAKEKLLEKVKSRGFALLDEFRPVLPADAKKALQWKETFINDLTANNFQEQDDDFVVLDKDGAPLKDMHGYTRKFKEFAKGIADKYFDYQKADPRSSAGNKEGQGTGGEFSAPRTEEEYQERLRDPKITPKERVELVNYWSNKK